MSEHLEKDEQEISLIDLLIILIKRRFLIMGFTVGGLILGILAGWVLPLVNLSPWSTGNMTTTARLQVAQVPTELRTYLPADLTFNVVEQLKSTGLLAKVYSESYGPSGAQKTTDVNAAMQQMVDKAYKVDLLKGTSLVKVTYAGRSKEKDLQFIQGVLKETAIAVKSQLEPLVGVAQQALGNSSATGNTSDNANVDGGLLRLQMESQKRTLDALVASPGYPFSILEVESVVEKGPAKGLILVILVLVGLVLGLLMAFLTEGWRKISQDAELQKRLHNAWKGLD